MTYDLTKFKPTKPFVVVYAPCTQPESDVEPVEFDTEEQAWDYIKHIYCNICKHDKCDSLMAEYDVYDMEDWKDCVLNCEEE
jgi:hypothetical protein